MQPNQSKDNILKPLISPVGDSYSSVPLLLLDDATMTTERNFYGCTHCTEFVSEGPTAVCPKCNRRSMTRKLTNVPVPHKSGNQETDPDGGGFVKGVVTYMVMDNLEVRPMSTISSITLLNKFNIKDVTGLEEKVVKLGMDEAVKLLRASLQSENVLTDVFLKGK